MAMKTTGAELKAFYADKQFWPDDSTVWQDDMEEIVNGVDVTGEFDADKALDADQITIDGYVLTRSGAGDCSFDTYFKRWRKIQDTGYFAVSAPKDKMDAIKAAVKAAGGKIL